MKGMRKIGKKYTLLFLFRTILYNFAFDVLLSSTCVLRNLGLESGFRIQPLSFFNQSKYKFLIHSYLNCF